MLMRSLMFGLLLFTAVTCRAQVAAPQADGDTVLLAPMEDAGAGRVVGDVQFVEGRFGKAARLDGKTAWIEWPMQTPLTFAPDASFTLEAWVRTALQGRTQQVFTAQPFCELEVRAEHGEVSFNLRVADGRYIRCTGQTAVNDGRWHHIAAVRDVGAGEARVYVDGVLDVTESLEPIVGAPILLGDQPIIGAAGGGGEPFAGLIDAVRVSRGVRTFTPLPDAAANAAVSEHILENDLTRLTFTARRGTLVLAGLIDKRSGMEFIDTSVTGRALTNLWQVMLRDQAGGFAALQESQADFTASREGDTIVFRWIGMSAGLEAGAADVTMRVTLPAGDAMSQWRIHVDNRSAQYGTWIVKHPRIVNLRKLGTDDAYVAIPGGNGGGAGEGQLHRDPFETMHPFVRTYPCYHQSMQFNAYYNGDGGLYLATHDGEMHLKGFLIQPQRGATPTMLYELQNYPADAGVAGTDFDADYPAIIGPFRGDWYDAARMYRKWALDQVWAAKGPAHQREDISPFIRAGAYWFMMPLNFVPSDRPHLRKKARTLPEAEVQRLARYVDVESSVAMAKQAYDYFGYPMILWSNEWFDGGGDTSPPRYIPMNDLDTFLDRLHETIPDAHYSAHIQPKRYSIQLREYGPDVIAALEHTPDGKLAMGAVMPGESNDQHAYPCWATDWWKNYWAEKSFNRTKLGIDGWHIDELGSAMDFSHQCFNRNHDHPVGGGTLYAHTRRDMVTVLRDSARRVKPTFAAHHEVLCEIYIDVADAAEVCTAPSNVNVPMYEAVYHDYNYIMGRRIMEWNDRNLFPDRPDVDGDAGMDEFVSSFSQTYIWGNQPGWTRIDIVSYAPRIAAFIKRMMDARYRALKYLNDGDMMRPPTVLTPLPRVERTWRYTDTPQHVLPVIMSSAWRAADGSVAIVLVNITDEPQSIHYQFDLAECGLTSPARAMRIDGPTPQSLDDAPALLVERVDEVEPYGVKILAWHVSE